MLSVSQIVYSCLNMDLGQAHDMCDTCAFCGGLVFEPTKVDEYLKSTFNDYAYLRQSSFVCKACRWFMEDKNHSLMMLLGRDKPQRPRNYSYIVKDNVVHILSKGNKKDISLLLMGTCPEVAIVAESGQKHLFMKARANERGNRSGYVLFEERLFRYDATEYQRVFKLVSEMYAARYNKASILSGQYVFYPDSDIGVYRTNEPELKEHRGSVLFDLCVYLATKAEDKEENDESV